MKRGMNKEQIIEGNKLIAEFMELKQVNWNNECLLWVNKKFVEDYTDVEDYSDNSKFDWGNSFPQASKLLYHSSWDWLMPVVEKIKSITEEPEEIDPLRDTLWWGNKMDVWYECVELIKEYNAQPNTQHP
jgi:hypothetical protein